MRTFRNETASARVAKGAMTEGNRNVSRWPFRALLGLLLAMPAVLAWLTGFDGLYGRDAFAYFDYARGPLRQSLLTGRLPPPFFWPLGFPVAILAASWVFGAAARVAQGVALISAAAVPVLTCLLARELLAEDGPARFRRAAMWAGLFSALTGQLWQSGMVVMADAPGLAFATASFVALSRYARVRRGAWLVASAALLAAALLFRLGFGLLVVPGLAFLLSTRRSASHPGASWRERPVVHALAAGLVFVLLLSPQALLGLSHGRNADDSASYAGDLAVYRWNPLHAARRSFDTADGHLSYAWPNGFYYAAVPASLGYFTPVAAPLVLIGAWQLWRRRTWPALWLAGGWVGVFYAFHAGAQYQNARFVLAYVPPMAVLAGAGAGWTLERYGRAARVALACAALAMTLSAVRLCLRFTGTARDLRQAVAWVDERTPQDAVIVTFQLTPLFEHYSPREVRDLYFEREASLAALTASGRPVYLVADTVSLDTQWRDMAPGRNAAWLRDVAGLATVAGRGNLQLLRVGRATLPASAVAPASKGGTP